MTPSWLWVGLTWGLLLAIRAVFLVTYPLNNLGGDTGNYYYEMMLAGRSNLVFAPGYPVLLSPVAAAARALGPLSEAATATLVLVTQHAIDLAVLALVFRVVGQQHGPGVAVGAGLLCGLDPFVMSTASCAYPEWLQGDLIALILALGTIGMTTTRPPVRWLAAAGMGLAAAWAVLTKLNSAPLVAGLLVVLLLAGPGPWTQRVLRAAVASVVAVASVAGLLAFHHQPSTGTWAISRDAAWVLMTKLHGDFGNDALDRTPALATDRWLALNAVLPPAYGYAHGYAHVDEPGYAALRARYRPVVEPLLGMSGPELRAFRASHPLPPEFQLGLSAIPVYTFVGLAEGDRLGRAAFWAFVRAHPVETSGAVVRDTARSLRKPPGMPQVPLAGNLAAFHLQPGPRRPWGYREFHATSTAPSFWKMDYASGPRPPVGDLRAPVVVLWEPGVRLVTHLARWWPPRSWYWLAGAIAAGIGLIRLARARRIDWSTGAPVVLLAVSLGFVAWSHLLLDYRWKEARVLSLPLAWLAALGVGWTVAWGRRAILSGVDRGGERVGP